MADLALQPVLKVEATASLHQMKGLEHGKE